MNFLDGRIRAIDAAGVTVAIAGLPDRRGRGPRPRRGAGRAGHARRPARARDPGRRAAASFADACVDATEQLGSDSYLYCELPRGQKLTIHAPGQSPVRRGERTPIGLRPETCHLFRADQDGRALPRHA